MSQSATATATEASSNGKQQVYPEVDLKHANILATGLDKKQLRVVNGLGNLMGTKEVTDVHIDELTGKPISQKERKHISEQPWTLDNWHQHLNWLNVILVVLIPLAGWAVVFSGLIPLHRNVLYFSVFYFGLGGISVTAGYHRLWSHRSYNAAWPLRALYAFFGAASVEGSVKWWGHSHRIHHRYTDTPRDPYDARQGLFYSHMGWMIVKPNPKYKARADISDLLEDWVVRFQHTHYIIIMLLSAFVVPTLACGYFFNDYWGGFLYAGVIRVFLIQQATFCINSMAHYIGTQPFDDRRTPRDNWITALCTFGEGYHNFHHEFPTDYRNAIKWYQYDPTKILIYTTSLLGLAWDLKKFSQNAIEQGILQQKEKKLNRERSKLNWGPSLNNLPVWDKAEFERNLSQNPNLVVIGGIIHDVTGFVEEHPGGAPLLNDALGKDATTAFTGGVYRHSNAAHNVLANMRVAVASEKVNAAYLFAGRRGERYDKKVN
ncbi:stearoyl-CoA 9-desaturase KNAG_0F03250 [Huiozyma naganishii CBS 8797]|uniref:Acyl-CoA desaturase n=1 Tax=Huiozyma naganishii (strain ATCC MYA-139 / BCRC 22969 / CBS 8797 / KCTC 17520 / NBRC 10181 / NCYC 3082 / Yp74L-3) TaxID=1071383 RepID=J7S0H3_HUIN7|nr:hypothetical protein KNAG_0F03250 [Kazachstania naganishii CBS 8797]CCK70987.1 hypothetical protein KNAG_0F03250 [Kazachstania naganishii CBS 8797]